jgi:hypothetical protein
MINSVRIKTHVTFREGQGLIRRTQRLAVKPRLNHIEYNRRDSLANKMRVGVIAFLCTYDYVTVKPNKGPAYKCHDVGTTNISYKFFLIAKLFSFHMIFKTVWYNILYDTVRCDTWFFPWVN